MSNSKIKLYIMNLYTNIIVENLLIIKFYSVVLQFIKCYYGEIVTC